MYRQRVYILSGTIQHGTESKKSAFRAHGKQKRAKAAQLAVTGKLGEWEDKEDKEGD